ncbi:sulfatase [Candidatus Daviesbacteria bacterium]|nr:sulfatase [Candidatus Daviesbacteria bacterium]
MKKVLDNHKGIISLYIVIGLVVLVSAFLLYNKSAVNKNSFPATQVKAATSSAKPNVVVIMTDDQTDKPHQLDKMPLTTSLIATAGATFTNNFDTTSLCCPSRSTFLTGKYAHNHHVWSNNGTDGGYAIFNQYNLNQNLPIWLQNAGYTTTLIGKYLNGYGPQSTVIAPGWSEWHALDDGGAEGKYYSYYMNDNGVVNFYGTGDANYNTTVLTNKATSFINAHAADSAPYFMYVAYTAPHGDPTAGNGAVPATQDLHTFDNEPLPTPPNFNEADVSDKFSLISSLPLLTSTDISNITNNYRKRLGALQSVDRGVQSIYNALQSTGKLDNTVIIFTSDNGFEQGEHRIPKAKGYPYEESLKVPLLIKGPNVPVETINNITANIDLAPTIVELAGATAGTTMDGLSLVPLYQNPATATWRNKLLIEGISQNYFSIRRDNSQYSHIYTGETEYYADLTADPWELNASKTLVQSEEDAINALKVCAGATCNQ